MTGPEHYREAERLLAQADGEYLDDSNDAGPREQYASDGDWTRAMQEGAEAHVLSLRTAMLFAQMATAHAILASNAATAMTQPPAGESTQPGVERVTVYLTPASCAALARAAEITGDTRTDTINRAIQTYSALAGQVDNGGQILLATGPTEDGAS